MALKMKQVTTEIKERVFALYWGQKVVKFKIGLGETGPFTLKNDSQYTALCNKKEYGFENAYLQLTPLHFISDNDCFELCKYWYAYPNQWSAENGSTIVLTYSKHDNMPGWLTDYLRSKGYALPAFGYSVDELVEVGVFKLRGEQQ